MNRKMAREMAVRFLFQIEFQKNNIKEQVENFLDSVEIEDYDKDYFLEIINGVINSLKEIDEIIESKAKDWTIDRMAKMDLPILRVAIYEMKHREDIPVSVSINEAVELAKKFSSDASSRFINGVLGQV
ncbi:MAG: transcription antitermination factor NusB [Clostridia bacterium]|nr:transcription antitermination factor NusB [Clostridia bacterium]